MDAYQQKLGFLPKWALQALFVVAFMFPIGPVLDTFTEKNVNNNKTHKSLIQIKPPFQPTKEC